MALVALVANRSADPIGANFSVLHRAIAARRAARGMR
jgi:hypothetical protein